MEHEYFLAEMEFMSELRERLIGLGERLTDVETLVREGLNRSYQQGVADACKARTDVPDRGTDVR
jgi:hypothetical protein